MLSRDMLARLDSHLSSRTNICCRAENFSWINSWTTMRRIKTSRRKENLRLALGTLVILTQQDREATTFSCQL